MVHPQAIVLEANAFRDACLQGRWADARKAADILRVSATTNADAVNANGVGMDSQQADVLWAAASSARSGLLKMLAAFSARVARGPSRELSLAAAAACTAMAPEVWPDGSADDLLSMSGVLGLLLRAAGTVSRTIPGMGGFATLRACRAAAELLTASLEASSPDLRLSSEAALLRDSTLAAPMQSVSEALLSVHPDPRLSEAFLEVLWRGLRRVAAGAALSSLASAHPALICLEECQTGLCSKLQSLSPDQLLAHARALALELCAVAPVAFGFMSKGCYEGQSGTAVLSCHCIALHQEGELEPYLERSWWELPWECFQLLDLRRDVEACQAHGFENFQVLAVLSFDHAQLLQLSGTSEQETPLTSPILELLLDGSLEEVQETFNNYMSVGSAGCPQQSFEESLVVAPEIKSEAAILVQESPKASPGLNVAGPRQARQQRSKEKKPPTIEAAPISLEDDADVVVAPLREEHPLTKVDRRPQRALAVKTAAKPKPGKPLTSVKKVEPLKPPQDAVQRVLEEASRLAREVAHVQKQFRESKMAVDARGDEASALLDDIEKAGVKRNRLF